MKPKDPKNILWKLVSTTSDMGSSVILCRAYLYLLYGEEVFSGVFCNGSSPSSVESYEEAKSLSWEKRNE